jgi:hypothetical protein
MRPEKPEAAPLYYAVMLGFHNLAEHLVTEHPEDVNARSGLEVTLLHVVVLAGPSNILLSLIKHGADMSCQCKGGVAPLH